jgi:LCP family protein required for cell wall assembly
METPRGSGRRLVGTVGYSMACIAAAVVLVVSGFSYFVVRNVADIGTSHAIQSGPSIGAQNILLMGLESRTNWAGQILPNRILAKLHAGSRQAILNGTGGNATNTLILIHIPAGGKKAVGFSIPRDDWVNFAGTVGPQQTGKVDQAYGLSMFYEEERLRAKYPNMGPDRLAFLGNEAGRTAAVRTVEKLTGVHIDHFAEVNLDGFYELAKVLGRVEVCLNHPVNDSYSGAHFRAGHQWLDPKQALAFVRQRHGLPNGDLDRTHRQQAFLASVMHQLRANGVLSDLTKMQALLTVAKQYVITDAGWNLLDFASPMKSLTSGNLIFHTLPIEGYSTIANQSVNLVNPAKLKAIVHAAFYPPPGARAAKAGGRAGKARRAEIRRTTVDVLNGGITKGLAARVSAGLVKAGYRAGQVTNTSSRATTAVLYGAGASASAKSIAALFGVTAAASTSVAAMHVEILLGASAVMPAMSNTSASSPSSSPSVVIPSTGPQGGAVRAKGGIPCVN